MKVGTDGVLLGAWVALGAADRLLLETDAPSQAGERYDAPAEAARLAAMLEALADLRRTPRDDLAARIARTSRQLFASA